MPYKKKKIQFPPRILPATGFIINPLNPCQAPLKNPPAPSFIAPSIGFVTTLNSMNYNINYPINPEVKPENIDIEPAYTPPIRVFALSCLIFSLSYKYSLSRVN